jgi:amylosucrase
VDYFTGRYPASQARGMPFGTNEKTGDSRISGSLASLVGLECAMENNDEEAVEHAVRTIILLHSVILSFGGLPLLYYGDAIGTLNNLEFLKDPATQNDSRWVHRSRFDWEKAEKRHVSGTVENRIFSELKRLIALRKDIPAFADFDNRVLIPVENEHLLVYSRRDPENARSKVFVICNFDMAPQRLGLEELEPHGCFQYGDMRDLTTGNTVEGQEGFLEIPALSFLWLGE